MDIKSKAVTSVKWNTANRIVCLLIGVIRVAILTRLLDRSDFGLVALAMVVIDFTNLFSDLGLTTAIIHKQNITVNQYSSIFWLNLSAGVVVYLVLCCISPICSSFYKEPRLNIIIPLLGTQVLMNGFGKIFQTIKTKELDFEFISKVSMMSAIIGLIITIILAILEFGVYSLVFGQLLGVAITQITYSVAGLRKQKIKFYFNLREVKDFVKIGGYQLGAQLVDFIAGKIDILLVGKFFTMNDLGVYNIAKNLINMPYQLINSIVSGVGTSAFALIQNDIQKLKDTYSKIVNIMSAISLPIYTMLLVFATPIVEILYAPEFSDVSIYLRILAPWGFFASISSLIGMVVTAKGRTDLGFNWTWVRILMNTAATYVACYISVYAIACSQTLMGIISIPIYFYMVTAKVLPISLKDYFGYFARNAIYSLSIGLIFLMVYIITEPPLILSIFLMVLYPILYSGLHWLTNKKFVISIFDLIFKKSIDC